MIFSRRRRLNRDQQPIVINGTQIHTSRSCTYLGLVLDERLNWREHISNKCASTKRLLFAVNKCCRLSWGLSRDKIKIIYKSIFLPKLLYGCLVWGGTVRHAWCKKMLRSAQRPLIVAISKSFKSNSSLSSLILANLQPIDLEIKKRICFTALTADSFPLAPSSAILVNDKVSSIRSLIPPSTCTYKQFVRSAISSKLADDWNDEWVSSDKASQTRSFFPTVSHSDVLSSCRLHAATVQVLTGHSLLNGYQAKINRRTSALCDCGTEEETVSHFLFDCSLFHVARAPFKRAIQYLNISWPPDLSLIPQHASSWKSMVDFIHKSKRFRFNYGSTINQPTSSCHHSSAVASFSAGHALGSTS